MINNRQAGRRRGRGGNNNGNGGGNGPRTNQGQRDTGNRIDSRARGNANQLYEKYKNLASDSQRQGDRVNTEYYLQFADHYFRVLSETRSRFEEQNQQRRQQNDGYEAQAFTGSFDTGFDSQDDEFGDEGEPIRQGEQAFGDDRGDDRGANRGERDGNQRDGNQRDGQREGPRDAQRGDRQNGDRQHGGTNGQPVQAGGQNPDRPRREGRPQRDGNRQFDGGGERDVQDDQRDAQPRYETQRNDAGRGDTQRDAVQREGAQGEPRRAPRIPRRGRDESVTDAAPVAPEPIVAEPSVAAPVAAEVSQESEAPRRRGRPRRERPADDEPAAFDAALLPPSLGVAPAADEGVPEEKPRRRRVRAVVEAPPAAE